MYTLEALLLKVYLYNQVKQNLIFFIQKHKVTLHLVSFAFL